MNKTPVSSTVQQGFKRAGNRAGMGRPVEKPKDQKKVLSRLVAFFKKFARLDLRLGQRRPLLDNRLACERDKLAHLRSRVSRKGLGFHQDVHLDKLGVFCDCCPSATMADSLGGLTACSCSIAGLAL